VLTGDAAWDNSGAGFNDERDSGRLPLTRDTAFRNGAGFRLAGAAATLAGDFSQGDDGDDVLPHSVTAGGTVLDSADGTRLFASTVPDAAEGPRRRDGGLPATRFLSTGSTGRAGSTGGAAGAPMR
jgi:hypothetical protein